MKSSANVWRRRKNKDCRVPLFLLVFVSFFRTKSVSAYANWLKCYIEFDPEEVVMRHHIVPFEESEEKVYVEVQHYGSRHDSAWTAATQLDLFTKERTAMSLLKLRLKVPPSMKQKDVQFVMEATGEGVSFVGPGVMCDGNRAYSRQYDHHVILEVNSTKASPPPSAAATEDEAKIVLLGNVELVAAWAAGYAAVNLTPKMTLRRRSADERTNESTAGVSDYNENAGKGEL